MMIGVPKETFEGEGRVALVPSSVQRLVTLGFQVCVQAGLGNHLNFSDEAYENAGACIRERHSLLADSDMILRVRKPPLSEITLLKKGCIHISFLNPFHENELISGLARQQTSAVSLEMLPRMAITQQMDALSSQASLAGYAAVVLAASRVKKIFPLLMTPAGTIPAARVFVIGAGVAGLQAIATAKRLGARVDAFDTRPDVEEQVKSLGARFIKINLEESGQTPQGYARQLTPQELDKQRQGLTKIMSQSHIVITAAQVFGQKAPTIITPDMMSQMRPGSVVVDTAAESGGNVQGSKLDQDVIINGVFILAPANLVSLVALDASQMYSNNLTFFLETFWDTETKSLKMDLQNQILKSCLVTHQGRIMPFNNRPNTGVAHG